MTDLILLRSLRLAALRGRLNGLLAWLCGSVILQLAGLSGWVCWERWNGCSDEELLGLLGVWIFAPMLLGALAGGFLTRPSLTRIAWQIDRRAGLEEHLITWLEQRSAPPPADPLSLAFVQAQQRATLQRVQGLRVARCLPLLLPRWSPLLWLALLSLGCALLVPSRRLEVSPEGAPLAGAGLQAESRDGQQRNDSGQAPKPLGALRINPLSPTQLLKAQMALNPAAPRFIKEQTLAELEARVGAIPEHQLNPEVLELLNTLRKDLNPQEPAAGRDPKGGSLRAEGEERARDAAADPQARSPAPSSLTLAERIGVARNLVPDEAEALERYYRAVRSGGREAEGAPAP